MFESCTFSDKKCDDWPSHDDMLGRPGVDFINILLTAFTSLDPKAQKYSQVISLFLRFWDLRL